MELSWNVVSGLFSAGGSSTPSSRRRRPRQLELSCESLEGRVVPSHGGLRAAALHAAAVHTTGTSQVSSVAVRGRVRGASTGTSGSTTGTTQDAQLTADLTKLRTDINAVFAGSGATDAQRLALSNDLRAIRTAGFTVDKTALAAVADSVLTDIANGADPTTDATLQSSFSAAFSGGTDTSGLIAKAYTDFVSVARALNIDNTTELPALSADRSAIAADYARLGITPRDVSSNLDLVLSGPGGHGHGGCG
jgi:hypothetical protein